MQTNQPLKTFIKANFDKITPANIKAYYLNYIETSEDEIATLKDFKNIYEEVKAETKETTPTLKEFIKANLNNNNYNDYFDFYADYIKTTKDKNTALKDFLKELKAEKGEEEPKEEPKEEQEEIKSPKLKEIEKRILFLLNLDNLKHTANGLKSVNYSKKYFNYLFNNNRLGTILNNLEELKELISQYLFNALKEFWEKNKEDIINYYEASRKVDIFNIFDSYKEDILFFYFNLLAVINYNYNNFNLKGFRKIFKYLANLENKHNPLFIKGFINIGETITASQRFFILDKSEDLNQFNDFINGF